ncbi:MAG: T9SS C-terminal target domain-containing protein [Paludibacter sp.]|nr:T9SS C-terminal target domain-containing protein [Paludibacter sp.]
MNLKSLLSIVFSLLLGICLVTAADLPSFRVDINRSGRSVAEGNNTNFLPWTFASSNVVKDTLVNPSFLSDTVVVQLRGLTLNNVDTLVWNNYYKAGITSTTVTNDAKLTLDGGFSRVLEMTIHGLPAGQNTLLTYHNNVDAATAWTYNPIRILVDGKVAVDNLMPTVRELVMANVPVSYLIFNVEAGKDVVIRFEPIVVTGIGTLKPFNCVPLNGFEINTPNSLHQAFTPYPDDRDEHVDGDAGTITLKWRKAATAATHNFYFGTDSATVVKATPASPVFVGNKSLNDTTYSVSAYDMNKYFWRVDELTSDGTITKGNTWYFRARHLAFRGAEGYGRFAMGGRGGKVVHVTNLNDDGDGSFRQAVTGNNGQPRTVVFDVSGIIRLNSRLVTGTNITVAGQTAPGKGICFRAAPVGVSSDCICRFVRMRLGGGQTYDGMGMAGVNHGIVDHCSIGWTIDEAFSSRNAKNITLQHTMISEALNVAGHQNYPAGTAHGYAGSIGGNCGSFHHNLLAHNEGRNWSLAGGLDGNGYYAGKLDIFNMVVYNYGGRATDGGVAQGNFFNNYYKKGPATSIDVIFNAQLEGTGKGSQSYYYSGNIKANQNGTYACDGTDNTCGRKYSLSGGQVLDWNVFVDQSYFPSYATIETAADAYKSVLSDVGCTLPVLDDHDKRIVRETQNGTYTYVGSVSGKKGLIDNEADAGGYEDYGSVTRAADFDTDGDGLPDWWENLMNTNPKSAVGDFSDSNADPDKDGYTALEDYLEWMSVPHNYIASTTQKDTVNLARLSVGYTKTPVYSLANSINGINVVLKDSNAIVTAPSANKGIYYLYFKTTDSEGSSITRKVGVCIGTSELMAVREVEDTDNSIKIYPTVFENQLHVSTTNIDSKSIVVNLENLLGQVLLQNKYDLQQGTNDITLNYPASLAQQLYIVVIKDALNGKKMAFKRVVKK